MSDFELLSIVLNVLGIIVALLIAYIQNTYRTCHRQLPPDAWQQKSNPPSSK